ncbi:MAG: hypothetical protein BWZ00_00809 [Bacteroidetes bacterium ADurb.BinA174]|nr:MAG: hypothetical protein BWZ00_00809 [Bacteroidetes bacterium ADurb.BinA174]
MITPPSMMIPKSSAPKLIRLASMPKIYIKDNVNNNDKGIIDAIIIAVRKFPRMASTTRITMIQPKSRFSKTVIVVRPISSLRSTMGLMKIPSGRDFCTSATLLCTALITFFESAFLSIIIWPITFSPCPFAVIAPKRFACPNCTTAISPISTGIPFRFLITIFRISSSDFIAPSPRIK